jgi:hypothetical protein
MNTSAAILLVLFAFAGHRYSARNAMVRGTTPWRVPSLVWAIICLIAGPFGLLIEFVAVRTTKPVSLPATVGNSVPQREWTPVTTSETEPVTAVIESGVAAANDGSGKMALFGWYPDPTGRHERRYWDGRGWTSLVEDHLVTAEDPL